MTFHKLLTPLYDNTKSAIALNLAAEIARYFHAHVEVFAPASEKSAQTPRAPLPSGEVQLFLTVFESWRHQNGFEVQPECLYRGLPSTLLVVAEGTLTLEDGLRDRSRFVDLVCLAATPGDTRAHEVIRLLPALLLSGRSILLRPAREELRNAPIIGEPIVIGWNGSGEAVRALTGALPFIQSSRRADVITVGEQSVNAFDAYELVKYLAWSGVSRRAWQSRNGPTTT